MADALKSEINLIESVIEGLLNEVKALRRMKANKEGELAPIACGGTPHTWTHGRNQQYEWRECSMCNLYECASL